MFEIGRRYTVWMDEGDGVGSLDYRVDDFQAPLLRLHNPHAGGDKIVNTSAPSFIRAELSRHQQDIGSGSGEPTNFNHRHRRSGSVISGTSGPVTVGDIRDAIAEFPDDTDVVWGTCSHGEPLAFYRFKTRGEKTLGIEFS